MNLTVCRNTALFSLLLVFGVGVAHAEGTKIAIIDLTRLQQEATIFKTASSEFRSDLQKKQQALEAQGRQLQEDEDAFRKNADVMSPDDRLKKQKDLQNREADFAYGRQKAEEYAQQKQNELYNQIGARVHDVCVQVAREKGYDFVLQNVVVGPPSVDITNDVLTRLNASAGLGGGK
jgi:outer membrane protein